MNRPSLAARPGVPRRLVLGAALAAGIALAALLPGQAQRTVLVVVDDAVAADVVRVQAPAEPAPKAEAAPKSEPAPKAPEAAPPSEKAAPDKPGIDAEISIGEKGVVIKRRSGGERNADMTSDDHEFDSFEQFVEQAPWLAGLVFMVTAFVFLVPLVIIVLVIWYKMRSNRLRNETMLKLAERGVVAPSAAIDAVAQPGGPHPEALPAAAPLYEQAKQAGKRAAWSDLRKGVILGGIGLGLTFWSMLDDGSANGVGLILLFVGIGYVVLWYMEERQLGAARPGAPRDPRGGD